jgi:Zn-dependent M28 family amino/carboxypeptidase
MILALALLTTNVKVDNLKATLNHLATYPTRNTNTPECRKAVEWAASEFRKIPGLQVEIFEYTLPKGRRVPEEKRVAEVIATLPGESDHNVMVGGHIDTINLKGDPMTAIAPGINDDGSGVALTLECARILAQKKHRNTLKFIVFTGEEQGLNGSTALAEKAKREGWKIDAFLNNDIVGGSQGPGNMRDKKRVRLYSEDVPTHNGRELARFIEWNSRGAIRDLEPYLVFRKDRFQRGGDHTPFNNQGFTAVRFVETIEALDRQHTERDTIDSIDYSYLANVVRLNLHNLTTLANAKEAPSNVKYDPKQAYDTTLTWTSKPGIEYIVYWRDSNSPTWQGALKVGTTNTAIIKGKNKDDQVFAVGALGGVPISAN